MGSLEAYVPDFAVTCRAVLFDLDGVLVDSEPVVVRTWHRWAARHELDVPDLVRRAHGRRSVETVRELAPALDAEAEVAWLAALELSDAEGLRLLPGASAVFDALTDCQRAVVTSGGRALAEFRLGHVSLSRPSVLVAAEDVRIGKPAPDGYLLAADRLGLDARECVVIEDTPAGVAAGKAAGARVLAVSTTFPASALLEADIVVHSLAVIQVTASEQLVHLTVIDKSSGSVD
jgi:mannitol-1-/sugar-/sorbitol-6-phosphatase